MVLKRDAEIRCDKMAEDIVNNDNKSFWKHPKCNKATYPAKIDDVDGRLRLLISLLIRSIICIIQYLFLKLTWIFLKMILTV